MLYRAIPTSRPVQMLGSWNSVFPKATTCQEGSAWVPALVPFR